MVHFADIIYKRGAPWDADGKPYLPGIENGQWDYHDYGQRKLDRNKFDEFKTRFYNLQGWDPDTGYPKRSTLQEIGLGYVADELEKKGKGERVKKFLNHLLGFWVSRVKGSSMLVAGYLLLVAGQKNEKRGTSNEI
jgi:hypothetical protein